jgi:hypothetical protein
MKISIFVHERIEAGLSSLCKTIVSPFQESKEFEVQPWVDIEFDCGSALKIKLSALTDERLWQIYVLETPAHRYSIFLTSSKEAIKVNGELFELVVRTFCPHSFNT